MKVNQLLKIRRLYIMKKYRVYGWHITQCGDTWCDSVYDEVIKANSPEDAIKQAIQWNIEESCTGEYDADRDMIIYRDIFGDIEYILAHFYAVEVE